MEYGHIVISDNVKNKLTSPVIRLFTGSEWSHSFVTIPSILGVPMCIEASSEGVDTLRMDKGYIDNPDERLIIYKVNIPNEIKDEAIKVCLNELQVKYGYLELPWFAWRWINEKLGKDIRNQDNWSQAGVICSELCVTYLTACGLGHLVEAFGKGAVNAEDVRKIAEANPQYFTKITAEEYRANV
jgi:hypothetical protein